jgi:hypothetical protein
MTIGIDVVACLAAKLAAAVGCDDIDRAANELRHSFGKPFGHALAIGIVKCDVLAFEVAEITQLVAERIPSGRVVDDADTRNLRLLLRARRKRPGD